MEVSFSPSTNIAANRPIIQRHRTLLRPALTANLRDGCVLYNLSHFHHIYSYKGKQI